MGSLAALRAKYPRVKVYASAVEAEYISGRRKALRLEQAEALQPALPRTPGAGGEAFISLLKGVAPVPVDVTLRGGDVLDICGGCEVVDTPGHTPGHISLYLPAHGTVVTATPWCWSRDARPWQTLGSPLTSTLPALRWRVSWAWTRRGIYAATEGSCCWIKREREHAVFRDSYIINRKKILQTLAIGRLFV